MRMGSVTRLGIATPRSARARRTAVRCSCAWQQRTPVYGRVVPNPLATAELRSAFAGTLRAAPDSAWPAPGRRVRAGQVLGWVDLRIGPQERLDLQVKLREATARLLGAEKVIEDAIVAGVQQFLLLAPHAGAAGEHVRRPAGDIQVNGPDEGDVAFAGEVYGVAQLRADLPPGGQQFLLLGLGARDERSVDGRTRVG